MSELRQLLAAFLAISGVFSAIIYGVSHTSHTRVEIGSPQCSYLLYDNKVNKND